MINDTTLRDKSMSHLIYVSMIILALGLVTSTTLLALSHIFIIIPAIYFINKTNYKNLPISAVALFVMILVIFCSIIFNQDIAIKGYSPLSKIKYFIIALLSVAPFSWFIKNHLTESKKKWLIYLFCISTSVATISGTFAIFFGFNPLLMKVVIQVRNSGLFGMVMNYAHNISFFLIINTGLIIHRNLVKEKINTKFLITVFIINLLGLYFSFTRGAWLGLLVGIPFYFFREHKKLFASLFSILFLLGALAYFFAGDKVIRPQSESERISQWKAAIKAFEERPILGYGYLNFESHSGDIKRKYNLGSETFVSHAHNNFFEMLAGTGILGFAAFLAWLIFWFIEMYRRNDLVARIGFPFIVVFVVGGLTQSTISLGINLFFIMAAWSLTTASGWSKE